MSKLELIAEQLNDARHFVRHAFERRNHWKAFYGVAPIAEEYCRSDVDIHLHILRAYQPTAGRINYEDSAVGWERTDIPNLCIRMQLHPVINPRWRAPQSSKPISGWHGRQNRDEAVLVGVVQFLKKKKRTAPTPIPSLVWLKPLDACPQAPRDALKEYAAPPAASKAADDPVLTLGVSDPKDREGRPFIRSNWDSTSVTGQERELPSQPIERGAEVVGNFADAQTPLTRKRRRLALDAQAVAACVCIELGEDDTIGVSFEEPLKSSVQGFDLALCPLDPSSWPIEIRHERIDPLDPPASQSGTGSNAP